MGYYFENEKDGYSCKDTILTYNLEEWQLDLLKEVVKVKKIKGSQLKLFLAKDMIDYTDTSHFIAFLNFTNTSDEDKQRFFDSCIKSVTEIKSIDEDDNKEQELIKKSNNSRMKPTYILNFSNDKLSKIPYLYINSKIFEDKEKLRLTILHEIKEIEKVKSGENEFDYGWLSDKGKSMKQRRLLLIYRHLLFKGWINKEQVDKLCRTHRLDLISSRSFLRDLETIRSIGEVIGWNKDKNRYEYGHNTYTHTRRFYL